VLNGDGTISKITIVRASGYLPYDAAAIDVAYTAGPFPDPPREIRSRNGKIYVHWRFYRDGRQCATSGVDYFILDNPPPGGDQPAVGELAPATTPRVPTASRAAPGEEGPRHLRRDLGDDAHRAKLRALDEEVARAEGATGEGEGDGEAAPAATAAAASTVAEAQTPAARAAAKKWFGALATGDVTTMTALAETPFRTTGGAVVKARGDLGPMLTDLATELGGRGVGDVQVFTAAGLRAVIGRLPPGLDDSSGLVFALAQPTGGDALIAALAKRGDSYRVVAFVRR
jgi:TonB family protein